ncbi:MarR family winged helix-turn-helix transcriptional regulator [Glutamicibacter ardleyensis]|jgi:DNA-binding MarR family transcriptional regulator|uniref:MarR family winged helix-turn-helix transcriptional regulator n=1 Tax=Glutamicibacter ardleyensis TaxID=225894 RepID=UPI003FB75B55
MSNNPSHQLVALLREFAHASDRYVESTGALHGTHRTDMNALSIIMKYQQQGTPPSPRDLSHELHLSSPATTAMLDRLEKIGFIERQRTDRDRRVVRIAITDKARTGGREMFMPLGKNMLDAIAHYDAEQIALITDFMGRIIEGVDSAIVDAASQHDTKSQSSTPNA